MQLTQEEQQAIANVGNVRLTVDGIECVLVRADIFERIRNLIAPDTGDDPRVAYPAILRAWDQDGDPQDAEDHRDLA